MIINNKRALAYITTINDIIPIPNYDRVEHAVIGGWRVIVSKDYNFKPGDKCIYIEVDSLVPNADERFAFLDKKKYRIKTIKMCGVYSQGLVMPISEFPEVGNDPEVMTDVTDVLGITYYVPEDNVRKNNNGNPNAKYNAMCARHKNLAKKKWWRWLMKRTWGKKILFRFFGKKKDNPRTFPKHFEFVHKTDEERCENMPWVLEDKSPLIVTEKLDGTSSTYILERKKHNKFEFYVCSRNVRQHDEKQDCYHDTNIYWDMAFKYDIENKLKDFMLDNPELDYVCLQGESVGSVQGNPLKLKEDDLYIFNFIRSDVGRISSIEGRNIIASWGMKWVPILDTNYILPDDFEEFKEFADAKSVVNPDVLREGVVLRNPKTDFSFKNVSRKYLMEH